MAKKVTQNKQDEEVLLDVTGGLTRAEQWFNQNKKILGTVGGSVVGLVALYLAYQNFYQAPREREALDAIAYAEIMFEKDSLDVALNGRGDRLGLIDVSETYSGTKAGNLAHYYAGIAYLQNGAFEDAIKQLDQFKPGDAVMKTVRNGAIGDAFHELGQPKEALDYYQKAAASGKEGYLTPFYLKKAGLTAEMLGDYSGAKRHYERIQKEYPKSNEGTDISKFLARIEGLTTK
ncbi:tetratricopeptide repeat protein [bacterium]|nr:tetratricopeptide repeat protein [bacterium]